MLRANSAVRCWTESFSLVAERTETGVSRSRPGQYLQFHVVFFPESSTLPGLVIIGGETKDVPIDLNTVVEKGENNVQPVSGHDK